MNPFPNPAPDVRAAADAWLARRQSGRWGADDDAALARWLAADPAHAAAWREAESLWRELGGLGELAGAELARARRPKWTRARGGWAVGWALAGGLALWLAMAVPVWLPGAFDPSTTLQTARGEQRTLKLPDGSTLVMNTATRVELDYSPTCRCLRLVDGEAVLRVAHGDPRPFDVATPGAVVRDVGTVFWLRHDGDHTGLAVLQGAVEVRLESSVGSGAGQDPESRTAAPRRLYFEDRLAWNGAGEALPAGRESLADLLAWRDGALVFRDAPLTDALAEFARYHDVRLAVDRRLADFRVSGRFEQRDLDGFLELIARAYPVALVRDGKQLQVSWQR